MASSAILPTHAQDATTATTGDETQLQTIVVKGKRVKAGSVADTPLCDGNDGGHHPRKEIKDLSDLGTTTEAGVDFIKAKPGRTGGLFIRGLTGARIAVLVDEIPVPFLQSIARTGPARRRQVSTVSQIALTWILWQALMFCVVRIPAR